MWVCVCVQYQRLGNAFGKQANRDYAQVTSALMYLPRIHRMLHIFLFRVHGAHTTSIPICFDPFEALPGAAAGLVRRVFRPLDSERAISIVTVATCFMPPNHHWQQSAYIYACRACVLVYNIIYNIICAGFCIHDFLCHGQRAI